MLFCALLGFESSNGSVRMLSLLDDGRFLAHKHDTHKEVFDKGTPITLSVYHVCRRFVGIEKSNGGSR